MRVEDALRVEQPRQAELAYGRGLRQGDYLGLGCLIVLASIVVACVFVPLLVKASPTEIELVHRLRAPSWSNLAGTDELGRSVLIRVLYGGRISLMVGSLAVCGAGALGTVAGVAAGYFGGVVDMVLMRLADIQLGIPGILLAIVVIAVLGPSIVDLVVVLAVSGWTDYARVLRSRVLTVRNEDYVRAATIVGVRPSRIVGRHILPNLASSFLVIASLQLATMILYEASLSFLGLGVQPPTPSWGNMIFEGQGYLNNGWWIATAPGIALVVTVISVTVVGDWLRDRLDPRLR